MSLTKDEVLRPLARRRGDAIVVATMAAVRPWGQLSGSTLDFAGLARAAGFPRVHGFLEAAAYETALPAVLEGPGPVFVAVRVEPGTSGPLDRGPAEPEAYLRPSLAESARQLRRVLAGID